MDISVASHARRKLRRLERYLPGSKIAQDAAALVPQFPADANMIVGCYRNDSGSANDWIVFTTDGLSAKFDGVWRHIPYAEISSVVREDSKNIELDEVTLELGSQTPVTMLVNGKDVEKGVHDKYDVMMFLESVIGKKG